jgi:uncharacterized membrane protein YjgN (DUF898 family)
MTFAADTPTAVSLSEPAPPAGPVGFLDRGGLFALLVKNAVLSFLTLGIYRFWARAALRRYWWGSITIAGDPLEYTGTGLELFVGFLMFLGIMLPFGVAYGLTAVLQQSNPLAGGLLRLVEFLVLFVLIQFVTFRARRYRLSRTLWRGVRASQGGTSWQYLQLVTGWSLLSGLTLGLAVPWARVSATQYLMDRTALGDLEARFDGRGRDLFLPWLLFLVPVVAGFGAFGVLTVRHAGAFAPGQLPPSFGALIAGELFGGLGILAYLLIELRYTIRHTRFGDVQLGSTLSIGGLIGHVIGFCVVALLVLTLVTTAVAVVIADLVIAQKTGIRPTMPAARIVVTAVMLIIGFGLINILRILWVDRVIVRRICDTMSLTNPDRLDRIGQSTAAVPGAGEGMADAFDIGAF